MKIININNICKTLSYLNRLNLTRSIPEYSQNTYIRSFYLIRYIVEDFSFTFFIRRERVAKANKKMIAFYFEKMNWDQNINKLYIKYTVFEDVHSS